MKREKSTIAKTIRTFIIMLIFAVGIILLYDTVTVKKGMPKENSSRKTEVEELLNKDFETKYPQTARETVKMYARIITCFYNQQLDEETLEKLAKKNRELFDEELIKNNPWNDYYNNLQKEINQYAKDGIDIYSYEVQKGDSISYYKIDDREYASVQLKIITKDAKVRYSVNEEFILRKDDKGNYKILGWKLAQEGA